MKHENNNGEQYIYTHTSKKYKNKTKKLKEVIRES